MKINIVKSISIDEDKLIENINNFERRNNQKAYLFMNEDTINALCVPEPFPYYKTSFISQSGIIYSCKGRNLYIDNNLKMGEVEIR